MDTIGHNKMRYVRGVLTIHECHDDALGYFTPELLEFLLRTFTLKSF